MISKDYTYAVVGASKDTEKYGHRVLKDLLDAGYRAIPINPKEQEILEQRAYPTLSDYDNEIDVAIFVVPPNVTEMVVQEAHQLGITNIWMQPGSESEVTISYCRENGLNCVAGSCIMIERHKSPDGDQAD